jgi:SAM-dependent methyltransferase
MKRMDLIDWIFETLRPEDCNSETFFYDQMESQSGYCLPVIYQPFNASDRSHWNDRGSMFDFLFSTQGERKRLLDFGPGDGWPSLIVAPFAREVVGVDGSQRRVRVCSENAARLGLGNVRFEYVTPGCTLPFPDNSFDGILAATSVEQTADPRATLCELFRVLRPGGRLRIAYESLGVYRDGQEREINIDPVDEKTCRVTVYDRHIDQEQAHMFRLDLTIPEQKARKLLFQDDSHTVRNEIDPSQLVNLRQYTREALTCTLTHPSGKTFARWLSEIGFQEVLPTHSGAWFAGQLFDQIPLEQRPKDMQGVDTLLQPLIKVVVQMPAPLKSKHGWDPMITAVK